MKNLLLLLCIFTASLSLAQEVKFGKVSKAELSEAFYEKDSSASAVVLFRNISHKFNYIQNDGFHLVTHVHERIKIYNKNGFDYATISEALYHDGSTREALQGLKGYTYTLEEGEIVKTKLKSSESFTSSVNKYYDQEKFTMPNVKEGCVIEYQYRLDSPFWYSVDEIALQLDIPVKYQDVSIAIPEYFSFKPNFKGYLGVMPKYSKSNAKINYTSKTRTGNRMHARTNFSNEAIDYTLNTTQFLMEDVPALKEEPYVNDMDNYRAAVNYELQYVQFPNSIRESYSTTWEKVVEKIYKSDYFGKQLALSKYFRDDLAQIMANVQGDADLAAAIFHHVQQRMSWNGLNSHYTYNGVKEAYKEKSGNTADINLMLAAMLREAGLEANPVLISTRDNGIPLFPTREGFNYVVVALELGESMLFLDASNKYTKPNLLPIRALNWMGRVIKKDGTHVSVGVRPRSLSREGNMADIQLNLDGTIEGKMRKSYTEYRAYNFRNIYNKVSEEDYLEKFENKHGGIEVSDYTIKNRNTIGKPITEDFSFYMEDQLAVTGDKIYFSPLFFHTMTENPFKLEDRKFPIDFAYPWRDNCMFTITIPQGYEVDFLPESIKMSLPENAGSFVYRLAQKGNKIQVMADLKINEALIPAESYAVVKELFSKIVEKESEKVVLSKTSENEHTERSAGGR
ncbi:DUF3857 domain-containing protein [Poritiphilus flavus]|uniref:DUF3857 domain-containing protein n=1 Tax=Poritiphilus flavus TaxID=2697053 RepID=A0A6L9EH19_9FLAO|nr:DUF3857 domain-containing protein [Poritiphilus flavus]NAS13991.1 DUF3857 domain-containing protein [Poritiphilus flavus]